MNLIRTYFPDLTEKQLNELDLLQDIYKEWNEKINLISRKDESNFYERHVLHSLGIAKVIRFKPDSHILDIGTGGGFPGIPLAILHPESQFTLVDSIGKKINVVNEVINTIELKNVKTIHGRAENTIGKYDYIVSRAVTSMPVFMSWTKGKFKSENRHKELRNGILYLKGGELSEELEGIKQPIRIFNLSDYFKEDFFETKKVVYIQMV